MVRVVYWQSTGGLIAEADLLGPKVGDVPSSSHEPRMFQKVQQLVPQFAPTCAMANIEEASVAGFQHIYPAAGVAGCWWQYTQAIIKIVHLCLIWCCVVRSQDVHPCFAPRRSLKVTFPNISELRPPASTTTHHFIFDRMNVNSSVVNDERGNGRQYRACLSQGWGRRSKTWQVETSACPSTSQTIETPFWWRWVGDGLILFSV